jgi:small GTP-binding protein
MDYDYLFKITIVGESGVGKSSLIQRYVNESFDEHFTPTIGVDFLFKHISVLDKVIKLQLWDTAGQERFRAIQRTFYRGSSALFIVVDVSDLHTVNKIPDWMREAKNYAPTHIPIYLVGNKCDLESRIISQEDMKTIADQFGLRYIETSAKSGTNVEAAFRLITEEALKVSILPNYNYRH